MLIGFDADVIGRDGSGNETFMRGLIGGLQRVLPPSDSIVLCGGNASALNEIADSRTSVVPVSPGLRGELTLGTQLRRAGADVAVGHYNAPLAFGGPVATIVHDVAFARVKDAYPSALRKRIALSVRRSVRVSDLIITVSKFSRAEILAKYKSLEPDDVVVAYNAPDAVFFQRPGAAADAQLLTEYDLPDQFVLAVGNVQPRKNLERLLKACARSQVPLVAVGQLLWKSERIVAALEGANVKWLGHVPRAHLAALYRSATAFAYPSLYEGFGLPVIEAMASETAVVTSNDSALAEVGGDAALLVDPRSTQDLADALTLIWTDSQRREHLQALGHKRARQFTWDNTAEVVADSLRSIVK